MTKEQQNIIESLAGWCSPGKREHMLATIRRINPSLIVEIGVFGGRSLVPMALEAKRATVIGIDPWSVEACIEDMRTKENLAYWNNQKMLEDVYRELLAALKKLKIQDDVRLMRTGSETVADTFAEASIDLLHIDGNHSAGPAMRDCQLYLPKVKPGGVIYMDDIGWTEGGELTVKPAYDWMCANGCKPAGEVDGCAVLEKA